MINWIRLGIRSWLLALAILASLPLFLVAAYSIYEVGQAQREAITAELVQRTESTANAVNQRLGTALGALNSLATSDAALRGDLPALYEHARRVVALSPGASAISLVSPDERMVFLTLRPFGTANLPVSDLEAARRVFETGKPVVSGPFKAPVSDRIVTTLAVPVFRGEKVAYCMRMVLLTDALNDLLAAQRLPADWTAGIVDRNGLLLARSRSPERYVGKAAAPDLQAAIRAGNHDVFDSVTQDGIPVKTAIVSVPSWDWSVVVGVPAAALNASSNKALTRLIVFGVVIALMGALAVAWLSAFISRHIAEVASASAALHRGEQLLFSHAPIRELHDVVQTLGAVTKREQRTRLTLQNLAAQHEQVATELESARHDGLTGLPGRVLFLGMVAGLRDAVAAQGGQRLALLFIDLDGFKRVNDTLGHDQGDKVLVETAEILRALTRGSDVAGRLGGDEFVVCIAAAAGEIEATAASVATRVVERVGRIGYGIGCSVGISLWADRCPDVSCAMRCADEAMNEAKRRGKNRHAVYGVGAKADGTEWTSNALAECRGNCATRTA